MSIQDLLETIKTLRSKDGCPWDRQQTHASLFPYLIEETYETIEAFDIGQEAFAEELGDVLLQIVMHCQIAEEAGQFNFADVAGIVNKKMIHRHPHVFGAVQASTPKEVLQNWEQIKLAEKPGQKIKSILDGVPTHFPALLKAERLGEKASGVGFDWDNPHSVIEKVEEEVGELREAIQNKTADAIKSEFGDLLFSLANLARHLDVSAEIACHSTNQKFITRFKQMESLVKETNQTLKDLSAEQLEKLWETVKSTE